MGAALAPAVVVVPVAVVVVVVVPVVPLTDDPIIEAPLVVVVTVVVVLVFVEVIFADLVTLLNSGSGMYVFMHRIETDSHQIITKVLGDPQGFGILVLKTEMRFYNSIYSSS